MLRRPLYAEEAALAAVSKHGLHIRAASSFETRSLGPLLR
jgi:hypothetical protein